MTTILNGNAWLKLTETRIALEKEIKETKAALRVPHDASSCNLQQHLVSLKSDATKIYMLIAWHHCRLHAKTARLYMKRPGEYWSRFYHLSDITYDMQRELTQDLFAQYATHGVIECPSAA